MRSIFILALISTPCFAEFVSTAVSVIGKRALTSREVQIQQLLEVALTEPLKTKALVNADVDSREFGAQVHDAVLEYVVALEADGFNVMRVPAEDLAKAKRQATLILHGRPAWVALQVEPREFDAGVRRKLQAQRFLKMRIESSALPVTDLDVQRAYDENPAAYGKLPIEKVRETIKSSLTKAQTEKRLKDWFDGLLSKYQVKNLIAEI